MLELKRYKRVTLRALIEKQGWQD